MLTHLPPFEPNARMEASIIEHSRVHERHRKIGHAGQFNHAVDLRKNIIYSRRLLNGITLGQSISDPNKRKVLLTEMLFPMNKPFL